MNPCGCAFGCPCRYACVGRKKRSACERCCKPLAACSGEAAATKTTFPASYWYLLTLVCGRTGACAPRSPHRLADDASSLLAGSGWALLDRTIAQALEESDRLDQRVDKPSRGRKTSQERAVGTRILHTSALLGINSSHDAAFFREDALQKAVAFRDLAQRTAPPKSAALGRRPQSLRFAPGYIFPAQRRRARIAGAQRRSPGRGRGGRDEPGRRRWRVPGRRYCCVLCVS